MNGISRRHNFLRYQLPAILWGAFILVGTSIPGSKLPPLPKFLSDKIVHGTIYLVLCFLTYRALRHQVRFRAFAHYSLFFSFILVAVFGAMDETHQLFVPGRTADIADFLADTVGACVCIFVAWVAHKGRSGGESDDPA